MTITMIFENWCESVMGQIHEVGDCVEWMGSYLGRTPVVYSPRGYAFEHSTPGKQSVRAWIWTEYEGKRPPEGSVIRMKCKNDRCIDRAHMVLMTRSQSVKETARRGQMNTPARRAAALKSARNRPTKLNADLAREIRLSADPSPLEAEKHGVSRATIIAIRAGRLWPESVSGSSVFNWRPE